MHIESPYRPDEPAPAKTRKPRFEAPRRPSRRRGRRQRPAVADAPGDRRAHAAVAADRGDLHDDRRGRPRPDRGRAREAVGLHVPAVHRPRHGRDAARVPALNATLEDDTLTTYDGVHLGIAVSLGEGGLIVPVIRDAQELSVDGLARRIKDLAAAPATNQLHARRGPRRLVHDHQPRRLRLDHRHAGDQPAAGRDPRHRGRRQAARWSSPTSSATTRSPSAP